MPATSWTENSQTGAGWQEGEPGDGSDDFYIDFLFEGTGFFGLVASTYTEASAPYTGWQDYAPGPGDTRTVVMFGSALVKGGAEGPVPTIWTEHTL